MSEKARSPVKNLYQRNVKESVWDIEGRREVSRLFPLKR